MGELFPGIGRGGRLPPRPPGHPPPRAGGGGPAFHSLEEWEALSGQSFRGRGESYRGRGEVRVEREPRRPARPDTTEQSDAFQTWRMEIQALFRRVMEEHDLDGLFFPQAGGPIRPLVEDPERPEYRPNNHPELPSNIINDMGIPTVTLPCAWYDDGMPFVLAFIGDIWTEAALLSYAYDLEQATRARKAPTLMMEPGG